MGYKVPFVIYGHTGGYCNFGHQHHYEDMDVGHLTVRYGQYV